MVVTKERLEPDDVDIVSVLWALQDTGAIVEIHINRKDKSHFDYVDRNAASLSLGLRRSPIMISIWIRGKGYIEMCDDVRAGFADLCNQVEELRELITRKQY